MIKNYLLSILTEYQRDFKLFVIQHVDRYHQYAILQYSMKNKKDLQNRISKIDGQINGIQKMIDNNRDCLDIVQQVVAVNSALKKVGIEILKDETATCVNDKKKFETLLESLFRLK